MMKVLIIKKNNEPFYVGNVTEMSTAEFVELTKKCEEKQRIEKIEKELLEKKIDMLEKKITKLEHDAKVDRGEID